MKREITYGQLIATATAIIMALAGGWISQNTKVAKLEERIQQMENDQMSMQIRIDSKFDKIDNKLDAISNGISDLKERKADRQ